MNTVIDRAKAETVAFATGRQIRDAWLSWPARIAALFAAEARIEAHQAEVLLEKYVKAHLNELADVRLDLS